MRLFSLFLLVCFFAACQPSAEEGPVEVVVSEEAILLNGQAVALEELAERMEKKGWREAVVRPAAGVTMGRVHDVSVVLRDAQIPSYSISADGVRQ